MSVAHVSFPTNQRVGMERLSPILCVWGWNVQLFTAVQGMGAFLNGKRIYGGYLVYLQFLIESGCTCIIKIRHVGDYFGALSKCFAFWLFAYCSFKPGENRKCDIGHRGWNSARRENCGPDYQYDKQSSLPGTFCAYLVGFPAILMHFLVT